MQDEGSGDYLKVFKGNTYFKKQYFVLLIAVLTEYKGNKCPCKYI